MSLGWVLIQYGCCPYKKRLGHKHTEMKDIRIIGMPEGEEEEQEIENSFAKIMKEYFPSLAKEIDIQVQEVQRVPNKLDPKRTAPRHIIIKMPRLKIENLKSSKRKELPTREFP